ncbi:MAG TPA: hypothetical protein VNP37_05930, partial [Actinomycetospora sp.]|nr:hypothetical protein [Actinomycetospora sp.]
AMTRPDLLRTWSSDVLGVFEPDYVALAVLDGLGHWWMVQDPGRGAAVLTAFWDSVEITSQQRSAK